ncbi:MAG: hypothetical protein Q8R38_04315 [Candidatus Omnitrophota bacterium]|nr:hypothetical protein [Candidatus Omnitrophota bacterium]
MIAKKKQAVSIAEVKKEAGLYLEMQAVIGDPDAKYLGIAKGGGKWFKNYKTGTLYRTDKGENGYEVKETRKPKEGAVKATNKKVKISGPTRQELMEEAKAKKIANFRVMNKVELAEAVKPSTAKGRIEEIQEAAVKRWKSGWKFQDKKKTEKQ